MHLVDSHCHLNLLQSEQNLDDVIENAISKGVVRIMVPGIDLESSLEAIRIAEKYDIVYAAVGFHPNDANKWDTKIFSKLQKLALHPKVKAIGEIGLDFYREYVPHSLQIQVFGEQLRLSEETGLPVIIHSRNALLKVFELLSKWNKFSLLSEANPYAGVLHAFEGNLEQAKFITKYNFFIGIGGPVTYKNSHEKHEIAIKIPMKSILLETDSPFLSPHPLRGKPNEPANVKLIAERIAILTEKPLKWISEETSKNANRLFAWEH